MNIMLDLETMSSNPNAGILSIGAVHFDTEQVSRYDFYCVVRPSNADEMSVDTVSWWMKQSDAARQVWNDPEAVSLEVALTRFTDWVKGWKSSTNSLVWGNGSDFDNVILASAYRKLRHKMPWSFRNNRCFRTLKGFFHVDVVNELYKKYDVGVEGSRHNALYDARLQAEIAKDLLILLERR